MVTTVSAPPVVMAAPVRSAPNVFVTETVVEESLVLGGMWKVTEARGPSAIEFLLRPDTRQRTVPEDGELQITDLPAAAAAGPVEKKVPFGGRRSAVE